MTNRLFQLLAFSYNLSPQVREPIANARQQRIGVINGKSRLFGNIIIGITFEEAPRTQYSIEEGGEIPCLKQMMPTCYRNH